MSLWLKQKGYVRVTTDSTFDHNWILVSYPPQSCSKSLERLLIRTFRLMKLFLLKQRKQGLETGSSDAITRTRSTG